MSTKRKPEWQPRELRKALMSAGMTQEALAREVGVGLRVVQFWLSGDREPKGDNLIAISRALGLDPARLYVTPEPEMPEAA